MSLELNIIYLSFVRFFNKFVFIFYRVGIRHLDLVWILRIKRILILQILIKLKRFFLKKLSCSSNRCYWHTSQSIWDSKINFLFHLFRVIILRIILVILLNKCVKIFIEKRCFFKAIGEFLVNSLVRIYFAFHFFFNQIFLKFVNIFIRNMNFNFLFNSLRIYGVKRVYRFKII